MTHVARILLVLLFLVSPGTAQETATHADHDFGVVKQGQKLVHVFLIHNGEDAPMRIDQVEADVPGISARFQPVIPAGAEGKISVEWNTAEVDGPVEATLVAHISEPANRDIPLRIKAVVKPPIELLPSPILFFTAYQDETPEKSVRIVNNDERPLRIEYVDLPKNHYEVSVDTVEPGRIFDVRVKVRSGIAFGRYTERIQLSTNNPENENLFLAANLFVKPDFYAFPETVDFGSVSLNTLDRQPQLIERLTQTIILTNRSGSLEVRSVTSDLPFLNLSLSSEQGEETRFRLDVVPVRERMQRGKITGQVYVTTNDPSHPELVIPVQGEVK
jgi:uncharacterized protein DUF1573